MPNEKDIENIIKYLDAKAESGVGRIKLKVSETQGEEGVKEVHHHGCCDVGSPWANGTVTNFEDSTED